MFPIMTTEGGMCQAFPNVCLTGGPPVPVPYPSIGRCSDGGCSKKVTIRNAAVLRVGDKIRSTTGDAAGNAPGGVVSGTFGAEAEVADTPQNTVRVEGKLSAVQTAPIRSNGRGPKNSIGIHTSPSQSCAWIRPAGGNGGYGKPRNPVDDAAAVLTCTESLQKEIDEFQSKGRRIRYGFPNRGSFTRKQSRSVYEGINELPRNMSITIDPRLQDSPRDLVNALAHELGHARAGSPMIVYEPGMTRQEFVRENVVCALTEEAEAVRHQLEIREEVLANCPDADLADKEPPDPPLEYYEIYSDPEMTETDKLTKMANRYAEERPSDRSSMTYFEFYTQWAERIWDTFFSGKIGVA